MPACGQGGAGDQSIVARQFINNFISLSHKEPNSACPCAECARRCQPSRGNLFEEETMDNHSKERTQAEAQLKKTTAYNFHRTRSLASFLHPRGAA